MSPNATLVDAGPLIALIDKNDPHHSRCVKALGSLSPPLITAWPVITEAMYSLGQAAGYKAQKALWGYINDGLLQIAELDEDRRRWAEEYMDQYASRPCDLADASLLALAETLALRRAFTIDGDFYIYVLSDGDVLEVIPGPRSKGTRDW